MGDENGREIKNQVKRQNTESSEFREWKRRRERERERESKVKCWRDRREERSKSDISGELLWTDNFEGADNLFAQLGGSRIL